MNVKCLSMRTFLALFTLILLLLILFFFFELLIVKELAQEQGVFFAIFLLLSKINGFLFKVFLLFSFILYSTKKKKNVHNFVHVLAYFSITFFLYLAKVFEYFLVNFVLESIEWPPINCFLSHENDLKFQYTSPVKFNCMNSILRHWSRHTYHIRSNRYINSIRYA